MNRRSVLATIPAVAIAGCLSNSDGGNGGESRTGSNTAENEPDSGVESIRNGLWEVEFPYMNVRESLRYYDEDIDDVSNLEPDGDLWALTLIRVSNLGGESMQSPSTNEFELISGGDRFDGSLEIPDPIEHDDLRLSDFDNTIHWGGLGPDRWPDSIDADETRDLNLLFDVTYGGDFSLEWTDSDADSIEPDSVADSHGVL